MPALPDDSLDRLFYSARTYNHFLPTPVAESVLRKLYDLARMGPTSVNASPMRIVFVTSAAGKERLKPALSAGNVDKTMAAPVTAIIAQDLQFYEKLPMLFPQSDVRGMFAGNPVFTERTAFRNSSLQGAYFILAARALGLDTGPMSGFNNDVLDAAFFPDRPVKSNFLVNLGYGDASRLHPRNPRLAFDEACTII